MSGDVKFYKSSPALGEPTAEVRVDEAEAALERVEKYVDHPGNWSALDGRRAHILALIRGEAERSEQ